MPGYVSRSNMRRHHRVVTDRDGKQDTGDPTNQDRIRMSKRALTSTDVIAGRVQGRVR